MLKLVPPGPEFQTAYAKACRATFEIRQAKPDAGDAAAPAWAGDFVKYLHGRLDRLTVGKPEVLRDEIAKINAHRKFGAFAAYCAKRPTAQSGERDKAQEALLKLVTELFDYDALSRRRKHGAYALIQHYRQRICPYCHMHHVNFYVAAKGDDALTFRPALDHFYPESRYPYLGVSLFNLVPACEQCNSRVKLARDPLETGLAHPFEAQPAIGFVSGWTPVTALDRIVSEADFGFKFAGADDASIAFAGFFHLQQRYEWYGQELLDMARRYRRFMEYGQALREAIGLHEYLLGYPAADVPVRALGVLLSDAAAAMMRTYGQHPPQTNVSVGADTDTDTDA